MSSVNAANKETVTLADESALPQQPTLSPALSPTTTATEPPASPETLDDLRHDDAIIITEPSSNGRSSDPEKMLDSAMDGDLPPDPIDPGNEPLILVNTVDGTEHMATDDSVHWGDDDSHELKRVKVYELEGARWADRGTAFCFGDFQDNEALLIARSEANTNHVILRTSIRAHDVYQRQQGVFYCSMHFFMKTNIVTRYLDRVDRAGWG